MDNTLVIIAVLSFGLFMVLFERWYCKYRTKKVKQEGLNLISNYGFNISRNDCAHYERTFEKYPVSLTHIPKINFLDRHALRLAIDFKWENSFEDLEIFVSKQRIKHHAYKWVANSIYTDIEFYQFKIETLDLVEEKLNEMINVLKSSNLEAIERNKGIKFGENFEDWQMRR